MTELSAELADFRLKVETTWSDAVTVSLYEISYLVDPVGLLIESRMRVLDAVVVLYSGGNFYIGDEGDLFLWNWDDDSDHSEDPLEWGWHILHRVGTYGVYRRRGFWQVGKRGRLILPRSLPEVLSLKRGAERVLGPFGS